MKHHRDPDGGPSPDPIGDAAHHEASGDGADAERRDHPRARQGRVAEVARERHQVDERDEDRDPRRAERGAEHPEGARPHRARERPAAPGGVRGDRRGRAVGMKPDALGVAPHHARHDVQDNEDRNAEDHVRHPPADGADEELREGRQEERAHAPAARGEAHGEAAPSHEPLHDGGVAGDVRGAHAQRRDAAVEHVGLPELGHERHARERRAEEEPARRDDDARAPEVGEPPRGEADDAVERRVEGERARDTGPAPVELLQQRREEHAEGVLRPVGGEEDEERPPDDDPAAEQRHGLRRARSCR